MPKEFNLKTGLLTLRDDGVLEFRVREGIEFSRTDAQNLLSQVHAWSRKKVPLLIDQQAGVSAGVDVFEFGIEGLDDLFSALAQVFKSDFGIRATNISREILLSSTPSRAFLARDEAEQWLKDF